MGGRDSRGEGGGGIEGDVGHEGGEGREEGEVESQSLSLEVILTLSSSDGWLGSIASIWCSIGWGLDWVDSRK